MDVCVYISLNFPYAGCTHFIYIAVFLDNAQIVCIRGFALFVSKVCHDSV